MTFPRKRVNKCLATNITDESIDSVSLSVLCAFTVASHISIAFASTSFDPVCSHSIDLIMLQCVL